MQLEQAVRQGLLPLCPTSRGGSFARPHLPPHRIAVRSLQAIRRGWRPADHCGRLIAPRPLPSSQHLRRGLPPGQLQEANAHIELRLFPAGDQTLGAHPVRFGRTLRLSIVSRVQGAEVPALPVLGRRRPIGIEDVSLVQDCVGDLLYRGEVHALTSLHLPRQPRT